MNFQDKSLQCQDCDTAFVFSSDEQELFQVRGYTNEPKRCPECRQVKKIHNSNSGYGNRRRLFSVTCSQCGQSTEVPFEPLNNRPVYCSNCYRKVRPAR